MKHLNIKIYGFVQGVSFRYFVEQKANELGSKDRELSLPLKQQQKSLKYVEGLMR